MKIIKLLVIALSMTMFTGCSTAFILEKTGLEEKFIHKRVFPQDKRIRYEFPEMNETVIRLIQQENKHYGRDPEAVPVKMYFSSTQWRYAINNSSIWKEPENRHVGVEAAFKYTQKDGPRYRKFADKGWCYMKLFLIKSNYRGPRNARDNRNSRHFGTPYVDRMWGERINILCKNIK